MGLRSGGEGGGGGGIHLQEPGSVSGVNGPAGGVHLTRDSSTILHPEPLASQLARKVTTIVSPMMLEGGTD